MTGGAEGGGPLGPTGLRVYLAGTRHDPRIADQLVRRFLEWAGFEVTSRWHDQPPGDVDGTIAARWDVASTNLADLDRADVVAAVAYGDHHLRGLHTEVGYAMGREKRVVVLGEPGCLNTMTETAFITYAPTLKMLAQRLWEVMDGAPLRRRPSDDTR